MSTAQRRTVRQWVAILGAAVFATLLVIVTSGEILPKRSQDGVFMSEAAATHLA
jgi:hypothetical protein